ncbi:hypothetical protein H0H92_005924 [Tricholoma furcatifolium]|nr:hypothetical protein H0H92_005924 [Tricholoma furcatifolium]
MVKSDVEFDIYYIPRTDDVGQPARSKSLRQHLITTFIAGFLAHWALQLVYSSSFLTVEALADYIFPAVDNRHAEILAPPYVGSSEVHSYPPTHPANADPTLFPSSVGYAGSTPTGAEPGIVITAPSYPIHTGAAQLVQPDTLGRKHKSHGSDFDLFQKWGSLSPWYSVGKGTFGVDADPNVPDTCRVTGLHFLHRHGARYPTGNSGPAKFAGKLNKAAANWEAKDNLNFLNEWDRMVHSALNFALGFFGIPLEGKYQLSITLEDRQKKFSNSLAPYYACANALVPTKGFRGTYYVKKWTDIYLQDALTRLQPKIEHLTLEVEDLYAMQQLCAYEFCELFTKEEWDHFNYASDLEYWYDSSFGSPVARVLGYGWVQELIARLTHTKITDHTPATNATLDDNPITFPLHNSLYVDATHEVVVLNILTALNLTSFAASGPLPYTHVPPNRAFETSKLAPFATNVQFQCKASLRFYNLSSHSSNAVLECTSVPGPQIRIIVNDGVAPLTGIEGCPKQHDGMCPVDVFVKAQKKR